MTLNGVVALILHYFAEFVYETVRCRRKTILLGLPRFQNLLLTVYDHINTTCAIIRRLFGQNKRRLPTPMSSDEFLVPAGIGWMVESTLTTV